MVNICDPASFPHRTYFEQHPLEDRILQVTTINIFAPW